MTLTPLSARGQETDDLGAAPQPPEQATGSRPIIGEEQLATLDEAFEKLGQMLKDLDM